MDLALLSANANQLRYVVETYARHPYYWFSLISISISLILQVSFEFFYDKFNRIFYKLRMNQSGCLQIFWALKCIDTIIRSLSPVPSVPSIKTIVCPI